MELGYNTLVPIAYDYITMVLIIRHRTASNSSHNESLGIILLFGILNSEIIA